MSQPKSGGLWARLMSLIRDPDEKPPESAPPPAAKPDDNGAAVPASAGTAPSEIRPSVAAAVPVAAPAVAVASAVAVETPAAALATPPVSVPAEAPAALAAESVPAVVTFPTEPQTPTQSASEGPLTQPTDSPVVLAIPAAPAASGLDVPILPTEPAPVPIFGFEEPATALAEPPAEPASPPTELDTAPAPSAEVPAVIPAVGEMVAPPAAETIVPPAAEAIVPPAAEAVVPPAAEAVIPPPPAEAVAPPPAEVIAPPPAEVIAPPPPPAMVRCPICEATAKVPVKFCADCGFLFPADAAVTLAVGAAIHSPTTAKPPMSKVRIKDRYELQEMTGEFLGIRRHKGLDHGDGRGKPVPVAILTASAPDLTIVTEDATFVPIEEDEIMPTFDNLVEAAPVDDSGNAWPSLAWEKGVLEKAAHPGLPAIREHFMDGNTEYLIEEVPQGRSLWDAWIEEPTADVKYAWLQQATDALLALSKAGAIIEGVRPDIIVVDNGKARITDLGDLLPVPLPHGAPVRATLYTAPEMILTPDRVDGRANLYSLGATLYALEYLHHGLEEKDFERQFTPRQVTDRYPDVHPLLPRLLNKTFVREVHYRFPSDEMTKVDPTGMTELIRTFDVCRRTLRPGSPRHRRLDDDRHGPHRQRGRLHVPARRRWPAGRRLRIRHGAGGRRHGRLRSGRSGGGDGPGRD